MNPQFFVVKSNVAADIVMELKLAAGPFTTLEKAIEIASTFKDPGEYVVYGPAPAAHRVTISAPVVTTSEIPAAETEQ